MGDGEGRDGDVADLKAAAGAERLQLRGLRFLAGFLAHLSRPCFMRRTSHEDGNVQFLRQNAQTINVIGMLMRDENRRKPAWIIARSFHAPKSFAAGDAGIHKNACARTGDDGTISPAAGSQHREQNSHAGQHTFYCCGNGSNFVVIQHF